MSGDSSMRTTTEQGTQPFTRRCKACIAVDVDCSSTGEDPSAVPLGPAGPFRRCLTVCTPSPQPDVPGVPGVPDVPGVPGVPGVPYGPGVPDVLGVPDVPVCGRSSEVCCTRSITPYTQCRFHLVTWSTSPTSKRLNRSPEMNGHGMLHHAKQEIRAELLVSPCAPGAPYAPSLPGTPDVPSFVDRPNRQMQLSGQGQRGLRNESTARNNSLRATFSRFCSSCSLYYAGTFITAELGAY